MSRLGKLCKSRVTRLALGILAAFLLGVLFNWFMPVALLSQGDLPEFTVTALKKWDTGRGEAQVSIVEAFRADGSRAQWVKGYLAAGGGRPAESAEVVHILLVPSRSRILILPEGKSVSTFPLAVSLSDVQKLRTGRKCEPSPGEPASEPASILGFRVVRKAWGNEEGLIEQWWAPELNCYPLRVVMQKRGQDGNFRVVQTTEAASVVLGEPDAKLFAAPADYVERSPLAAATERALRIGAKVPIAVGEAIKHAEEKYWQVRNQ